MASTRTLDPRLRPGAEWFVGWLRSQGLNVTVTSARRSHAEQARLYARYINGQSRYPAAPPGNSTHEWGMAFDLNVPPEYQQAVGEAWEYLGGRWGGRFKDAIHFEYPGASKAAAAQRPRQTRTVRRVAAAAGKRASTQVKFVGGARGPKDPFIQSEGLGPISPGAWWTGFVPGVSSFTEWLSDLMGI